MKKVLSGLARKLKQNNRGMTMSELLVATIIILLVSAGMVTAIRQATVNFSKSMAQSEAKKLCSSLETLVENELRYTNVIDYVPTKVGEIWYYRSKNYQSTETDCEPLQSFSAVTTTGGETADGFGIVTVCSKKTGSSDTRNVKVLPDGMYPHGLKANVKITGYNEGLFSVTVSITGDGGTSLTDSFTVKNLYYGSGGAVVPDPTALHDLIFLASDGVEVLARLEVLANEAPESSRIPTPKWSPVDGRTADEYRFVGWSDGAGHLYDEYLVEKTTSTPFTMPNTDVFLTAKYSLIAATVTFNLDGGSMPGGVDPTPVTVSTPAPITLPSTEPVKEEYEFVGWKAEGSSTVLPAGSTVTITETVTYVAQWEKSEYRLLLMNGKTGQAADWKIDKDGNIKDRDSTTFESEFHDGDQSTPLSARVWTLEGWYYLSSKEKILNADGTPVVNSAKLLTLAKAQEDGILRLYARWTNKDVVYIQTNQFEAGKKYLILYPYQADRSKALSAYSTLLGGHVYAVDIMPKTGKMYYNDGSLAGESYVLNKDKNNVEWLAKAYDSGIILEKQNYSSFTEWLGFENFNMKEDGKLGMTTDDWARKMRYQDEFTIGSYNGYVDLYLDYKNGDFCASKTPGVKTKIYKENAANTLFSFNGADAD